MRFERSNREIAAVRERPVDAAAVRGNRGSVVAGERLGEFFDSGLLHLDDPLKLGDALAA
jgi:hypothetical protein